MAALRETVRVNHFQDVEHAETFIETTWGPSGGRGPVCYENMVCYTISTTEHSTILILSLGQQSAFTINSFSAIVDQPWLPSLDCYEHGNLAQHIRDEWQGMIQHLLEDKQQAVNQIAKHVIYQFVGGRFVPVTLEFDAVNNVVRARIEDINIWSHPPRDGPLRQALLNKISNLPEAERPNLKQVEGNIVREARLYLQIPDANKEETKVKLKTFSDELYSLYRELDEVPDSYKWPTIQLGRNDSYPLPLPPQQPQQRYGGTFAGVYGRTANEVHNIFPARGVEPRIPSQEDVFNQLMKRKRIELQYADIFHD